MATIINKISLQNFFNYYGTYDENTYDFKEGVNIIVADNGAGKSKLFNALLWIFYDEMLDSDIKSRRSIESMAVKTISDMAKNESSTGDTIECGVIVEFKDTRFTYQVEKKFSAHRISDKGNITDESCWEITHHDSEVSKKDILRFKPIYDEYEKSDIINKLIRKDLRQYSFFQGEEVEDIIDFSKKQSIKDAVRKITNISKIEELEKLTISLKEKAENDYNRKSKENVKNALQLEQKLASKERYKKQLNEEVEKLEVHKKNHADAKQESHDLEDKIQNSEKKIELKEKRKGLLRRLKVAREEYDKFLDGINFRFFDGNFSWMAMGLDTIPSQFSSAKYKYLDIISEKKALNRLKNNPEELNSILPLDMPDTMTLDKMLQDGHCHVCNREAVEGSEPWNYIYRLKKRPTTKQNETPLFKNDFKSFFEDIQLASQPFTGKIEQVEESIANSIEKENELKARISKLNDKLKVNQNELKELLKSDEIDESTEKERNILNSYEGAIKRATQAEDRINRTSARIKELEKTIDGIDQELNTLRGTDVPVEYKNAYEVLSDISISVSNTRERIFINMLNKLEEYSNKHFGNLIKYNEISGGILRFKQTVSDTIELDVVDEEDNIVSGSSEGFQRMKKLAVVMAIISAKGTGFNYPMFADAPLSTFGKGFIKSFFEEVPNVFPQSIILINNIYDADSPNKLDAIGNDLLNNGMHVSTMYLNEVNSKVQQVERRTQISQLKG
ncbi:AAA family ATPase [uncultured Draconibacterium sp.]|uniref:AAA family ATPase n=1 Tax=uncultured Draconibacterium sp. TaxID=1573823 RepID=UPI00321767F7